MLLVTRNALPTQDWVQKANQFGAHNSLPVDPTWTVVSLTLICLLQISGLLRDEIASITVLQKQPTCVNTHQAMVGTFITCLKMLIVSLIIDYNDLNHRT